MRIFDKRLFSFFLRKTRLFPLYTYQRLRIAKYRFFSDVRDLSSLGRFNQPVLLSGVGRISLGKCNIGYWPSPYFINGYTHIEARELGSEVVIGDGVFINNNAVIIAEKSKIAIGNNTLIGTEFTVYDSDFHEIHPEFRTRGQHSALSVEIGSNVFIGSRVTVLKGVKIGENSVVASGSIVTKSFPENCILAGVPAMCVGRVA